MAGVRGNLKIFLKLGERKGGIKYIQSNKKLKPLKIVSKIKNSINLRIKVIE